MCGRYTLTKPESIQARFSTENSLADIRPNYNVAPNQTMPVITAQGHNNIVALMKWGLVPPWSKDGKMSFSTINARSEGIEEKPTYRGPLKNKRCIIPADGFYEWKTDGQDKQPYYFTLRDGDMFGFAGLWEAWKSPAGEEIKTYTIITTQANDIMKPIHNRMPVMLKQEQEDDWLNPDQQDPAFLKMLLQPYPANQMKQYKVGRDVGNVKNNGPELVKEST